MKGFLVLLLALAPAMAAAERTELLDGRVKMEIPEGLAPMSPEDVAGKYHGRQPDLVLTDETTRINVAFGVERVEPGVFVVTPESLQQMRTALEEGVEILEWRKGEIRRIGGLESIYFEFVTEPEDDDPFDILNIMVVTQRGKEVIGINLNCTTDLEERCRALWEEIDKSLRMR